MSADLTSARIDRATALMAAREIGGLLLSVGADLPYLTDYEAMPLERVTMLVVTSDRATLVVPRLEAPRVGPGEFDVLVWDEIDQPLDVIARLVSGVGRVAIGAQTWATILLGLQARLPETEFISADPLMTEMRIRKSAAEIQALAEVGASADRVADRLATIGFEGRSERELSRQINEMLIEEGHEKTAFAIVASGPNGASPHHEPGARLMVKGDLVVCDFGGVRNGYCSDTTRTFAVGEANAQAIEVHGVVAAAQEAARAVVRPGVSAEAIDQAGRAVIENAGYGEHFIHRIGHGIGREVHEHPYLVEGNDLVLEPGMCFSIEPGIYLPGEFGVRIEDIVTVSGDGVQVLNQSDRSLVIVG